MQLSVDKPNIVFVIGSLEVGGAERQMYLLVKGLHGHTHMCHVYSLESGGPLKRLFEDLGVPVISGGLKRGDLSGAPWKVVPAEWRLLRLIYLLKPAAIHCFLPLVTFMGALTGRLVSRSLVVTSRRAMGTHQRRHPILRPLDRAANRSSHRITVNSRAVWNDTVTRDHADESKLVLIYNGVEVAPFARALPHRERVRRDLGIKSDEKVIIVVANLIHYKGHSDLIRAARVVIKGFSKAKFLLVGEDRGIQKDLEQESSSLGNGQTLRFLGQRDDVPRLLAASDISVLPSHEEGFSNVILESMAAGLPVIATNVGGNGEAVLNGVTGSLVPPRNPVALAEGILAPLKYPNMAAEWGARGRERVNRSFTVKKMVEAHVDLYEHGFLGP